MKNISNSLIVNDLIMLTPPKMTIYDKFLKTCD